MSSQTDLAYRVLAKQVAEAIANDSIMGFKAGNAATFGPNLVKLLQEMTAEALTAVYRPSTEAQIVERLLGRLKMLRDEAVFAGPKREAYASACVKLDELVQHVHKEYEDAHRVGINPFDR